MSLLLRPIADADAEPCGRIVFEAFRRFHEHHRFPPDFENREEAVQLALLFAGHPDIHGVVAEQDGRIVGSNFLDERNAIRGVGPITVDPDVQGRGIGRRLMEAVIERGHDAEGIRLVQDGFNMRSLALYASLGFDAREPLAVLTGRPQGEPDPAAEVRLLRGEDLEACAALCARVHGFHRSSELRDAMELFSPVVLVREGRIAAYASAPFYWKLNHGVAESEADMRALLTGAATIGEGSLSMLVPVRQASFFRWCLGAGFRAVKPMTLMSMGGYSNPEGCWFPSVLY
jgi:GNAT superfamily N-acetyltransferase